jgi:hypothetical protein
MERLLTDLPTLLFVLLAVLLWFAVVFAILRMDQTTRALLFEARKTNAILLLAHGLAEAPMAGGKPRIVRPRDSQPGA